MSSGGGLDVCPSLDSCRSQLLAAAADPVASQKLLLVSFTDAGGFTMALNWAMHVRHVGVTPVLGLDGQILSTWGSAAETAAWSSLRPVLFTVGSSSVRNGYQRWRLRWDVVARLLALGTDVMMSDTDVVWLRDPRPYVRALVAKHPLLDVLIGTDHALYAEALKEEVGYTGRQSPTRRELIGALQTIESSSEPGVSPDFDLDPRVANGAYDGTWNPGMLLARASAGGAAFVLALLDALDAWATKHAQETARAPGGAARRNAEAEDLKVSDQSLMCDLARSRSDLPTVCSISRDLPLPQELYAAARAAV